MSTRPDFTDAPCRANPDLHFPNTAGSRYLRQVAAAKAVCAACPFIAPCAEFALREFSVGVRRLEGIWGGLTETERDEIRKRRAA